MLTYFGTCSVDRKSGPKAMAYPGATHEIHDAMRRIARFRPGAGTCNRHSGQPFLDRAYFTYRLLECRHSAGSTPLSIPLRLLKNPQRTGIGPFATTLGKVLIFLRPGGACPVHRIRGLSVIPYRRSQLRGSTTSARRRSEMSWSSRPVPPRQQPLALWPIDLMSRGPRPCPSGGSRKVPGGDL